jgi:hypothetical protein
VQVIISAREIKESRSGERGRYLFLPWGERRAEGGIGPGSYFCPGEKGELNQGEGQVVISAREIKESRSGERVR